MSINVISSAPYFLWKGAWDTVAQDSRDMGIVVTEYPPFSRPKERVTNQTIPGRQGQLTFREAEWPVYDQVLRTLQCYTRPGADIGAICAWLSGSGELTLGNDPDYVYDAVIINQIDFRQIMRGNSGYNDFSIPFQCQPFKRMRENQFITLTATDNAITGVVTNTGHVAVPAILTVHGRGNLWVNVTPTDRAIMTANIMGLDADDEHLGIVLDWDTGFMSHGADSLGKTDMAVLNNKVSNGPQYFYPGNNVLTAGVVGGSTLNRIIVKKNWRWL